MVQWLRSKEKTIDIDHVGPWELTLAEPTCIGPSPEVSPVWAAGTRITVRPPQTEKERAEKGAEKQAMRVLELQVEGLEDAITGLLEREKQRQDQERLPQPRPLNRQTMKTQLIEFARMLQGMSAEELRESWTYELEEILKMIREESRRRGQEKP